MSKCFLKLPKTENSLNKATLISWFKEIGDNVDEGEPILKISIGQEESIINSQFSGQLTEKRFDKGDIINVGDVVAEIENDEIEGEIEDGENNFNDLKNDSENLNNVKSISTIKSGIFYFVSFAATITLVTWLILQYNNKEVVDVNKELISQKKEADVKPIIKPSSTQTIEFEKEKVTIPKKIKPLTPEIIETVEQEEVEETIIDQAEADQDEIVEEVKVLEEETDQDEIVEEVEVLEEELDLDIPIAIVEEVPVFPGCEIVSKLQKRQCFQEKMMEHISKHFTYPEIAQEMGIQGRVFVQFIIARDGSITGIRIRGPDKNLEAEALRIILLLPKMTPGKQRGRPVRVPFSIPITFRLN